MPRHLCNWGLAVLAVVVWLGAYFYLPRQAPADIVVYWTVVASIVLLAIWLLSFVRIRKRYPTAKIGPLPFLLFYSLLWVYLTTTTKYALSLQIASLSFLVLCIFGVLVALTRWAAERAGAAEVMAAHERELEAKTRSLEEANRELERAQRELSARNRKLTGFVEVARICASTLNVDALCEKLTEAAISLAEAAFAATYLATEQGEFVLNAHRNASSTWLAHAERLHGEGGLLSQVAKEGKPRVVALPSAAEDEELLAEPGPKVLLLVPLAAPGRLEGILLAGFSGSKTWEPEEDFWGSIGSHIGVSMQNARLYWQAARAWQDLVAAQGQLIRAERFAARGELADGVAHEFNNVLACILANSQLLLRECQDEQARKRLELIEQAAKDGGETVQRLQRFAASEGHEERVPVDLPDLLRDVVELTRHRWKDESEAQGRHIAVRQQYDPLPPVEGNPVELREVFTNLVLNAVDALPRGGTITVSARREGDHALIEVEDDGVGMSAEVASRAFEPFFTTKRGRGTGLGLAVAAGIVSRHSGEISIRSRPEAGTTVSVRLPLAPQPSLAETQAEQASAGSRIVGRILLVEDEEGVREPIAEALRQAGHMVAEAASGAQAVEMLENEKFDMVITDVGMPRMSGWEVVKAAKWHQPDVTAGLLTGWAQVLDPTEARKREADFILAKPIDLRTLVARVEEHLLSRRERAGSGG